MPVLLKRWRPSVREKYPNIEVHVEEIAGSDAYQRLSWTFALMVLRLYFPKWAKWLNGYAHKIKEKNPVWVRGQSRALTAMAAGEYPLHQLTYYHSCVEAVPKDPTDSLVCKIIEPVPVRLSATESILKTAAHP